MHYAMLVNFVRQNAGGMGQLSSASGDKPNIDSGGGLWNSSTLSERLEFAFFVEGSHFPMDAAKRSRLSPLTWINPPEGLSNSRIVASTRAISSAKMPVDSCCRRPTPETRRLA
ncbi:MAG: hypothetical protein JWM59_4637 [Verrucomicrobiales bacterium]|nr:hypothetical protein [Verrucomicrobiales bacterium]